MSLPTLPANWISRGDLPTIDPATADSTALDALDEDLAQFEDPSGKLLLDVGWYPAATRTGRFICRAVFSNEWDEPIDGLETTRLNDVLEWIEKWLTEAKDFVGEPATMTNEAVASVIVPVFVRRVTQEEDRSPHPMRATSTSSMLNSRVPEHVS